MAIDFPNSPTTGDTYTAGGRTWQWDGTVWASYGNYPDPTVLKIDTGTNRVGINNTSPTTALDVTGDLTVSGTITGGSISGAGMTVSSSAPSSPSAGEMWYNDTTGRTFVYYNDGSSQQWVEFGVPPEGSTIALASYADAAARTTAIPSPTEADLSYLQDTNSVEVYDGSAWTAVGGGKILQVVSTVKTNTFAASLASGNTVAVTGLSASLTCSDAANSVLVIAHLGMVSNVTGSTAVGALVTAGGTDILVGTSTGNRIPVGTAQYGSTTGLLGANTTGLQIMGVYSPASTSAITYAVEIYNYGSPTGNYYVNRSYTDSDTSGYPRSSSSITLLEVAP